MALEFILNFYNIKIYSNIDCMNNWYSQVNNPPPLKKLHVTRLEFRRHKFCRLGFDMRSDTWYERLYL